MKIPTPISDCSEIPPQYKTWRKLCDEDPQFRQAYLEGRGPGQDRQQPTLLQKATRYAAAVARHAASGFRVRPPEEVDRIYETLCRPCAFFNAVGSCSVCGCRLSRSRSALVNKIRMATQHCPKGKW